MLKIQLICTIIAKNLLLTIIKQANRNKYLLNIFFYFSVFCVSKNIEIDI